jgi:hypothetical protein
MNPEQNLTVNLIAHPILYASHDKDISRLKILDHIFNCIGGGYGELEDFIENMMLTDAREKMASQDISRFFNENDTKFVYNKKYQSMGMDFQDPMHFIGILNEQEITERNDVKYVDNGRKKSEFIPYPNFEKEYSILWKYDMSFLSEDWLNEIKWFYQECRVFFNTDSVHEYHGFYPKESETKKWDNLIKAFADRFEHYKKDDMTLEEVYQNISDAYLTDFDGDVKKFIKTHFDKNRTNALKFIDETIDKIDDMLMKKG